MEEIDGKEVRIEVHDTVGSEVLQKMKAFLTSGWCQCERDEFLCYADDDACPCGVGKHHCHCANCGGVSQIG